MRPRPVGDPGASEWTKHPRQRILAMVCDNHADVAPFVEENAGFVPKTAIPSRKASRDYLKQGETDAAN